MSVRFPHSLRISAAIGLALLVLMLGFVWRPEIASAQSIMGADVVVGHVYVLNNTVPTDSISVFNHLANGTLTLDNSLSIGGRGTNSALGSQGSLQLSSDGQWLFAVDAGSNQISVLRVNRQGGLALTNVSSSEGIDPVSLTYSLGHLYVVNAGDSNHAANVVGFRLSIFGTLTVLPKATQLLSSANPAPGEIRANPLGTTLVVTEKSTNLIDRYSILADGYLGNRVSVPANGATPYGFAFSPTQSNLFIVSDAAAGAVTSYSSRDGAIQAIDGPVSDQQMAPCWVVVTNSGRFAYTANAGSDSVSAYALNNNGHLTLLRTASTGTGSKPVEMALSQGSTNLYTLDSGSHSLSGFRVHQDGTLQVIQQPAITLPVGSTGIAAN